MKRHLALVLLGLAACKSAPEPAPEPEPEPEVRASVAWSVPLSWTDGVPTIDARVRDGQTRFVISTSSSYHTLSKTFASSVRAPVSTGRQTSVVHGGTADVERVEGVVSIQSADADWRLEKVVATENASLDAAGIGGFVVPQRLVSNTNTIVLDFRGDTLTLVEGEPELFRAWFRKKYGEPEILNVSRGEDGLLFADGTVDGTSGKVLFDSSVATSRVAATAVEAEVPEDACLKDSDIVRDCVRGVSANLGNVTVDGQSFGALDAIAVPSLPGNATASLGAEALKKCVFAISPGNEVLSVCE